MTDRMTTYLGHGTEFDAFLFADVGQDGNDMTISVMSALARMEMDPRHEAARLARLPVDAAVKRLAALIAALPDSSTFRPDSGAIATIAARLVSLLPRSEVLHLPTIGKSFSINAYLRERPAIFYALAGSAMLVIVLLLTRWSG